MLANVLAVLLGLGSFVFYIAAFFYPEVHRRSDFLWGGLGLLYSGVLWFSAEQMTGLVLLGQLVAVALLLGLGWQTLTVRREKTPVYQQTPIVLTPEVVGGWAKSKLNELRIAPDKNVRPVRLERRLAEGSERLGARLDPRHRPAYDYEFVEDGVAIAEVQQGELFANAFTEELTEEADALDGFENAVAELDYAAPPSAEAEIVAVEPAIEKAAVDVADKDELSVDKVAEALTLSSDEVMVDDLAEELVNEPPTSKRSDELVGEAAPELVSLESVDPEPANPESINSKSASPERIIPEAAELGWANGRNSAAAQLEDSTERLARYSEPDDLAIANQTAASDEIDWGDDFEIADAETSASANKLSGQASVGKKPRLLAVPAILAGWVKDVALSLAKPKPSKPMIEIPRREPSVAVERVGKASDRVNRSTRENAQSSDRGSSPTSRTDSPNARAFEPPEDLNAQEPADSGYNSEPEASKPEDNWEESNWDD